jgi:hypothetical protein
MDISQPAAGVMSVGTAGQNSSFPAEMPGLHRRLNRRRAKHNLGFDRPAPVTDVSVNLKFDVQRVGHNLCKSGLGAAYRARVWGLERQRRTLKTRVFSLNMHVPTLHLTLVRCGRFSTEMILRKSNDKI